MQKKLLRERERDDSSLLSQEDEAKYICEIDDPEGV